VNAVYEAVGAEVVEAASSDKTLKQLCEAVEKAVAKQRRLLVSATESVIGTPGAGTPPSATPSGTPTIKRATTPSPGAAGSGVAASAQVARKKSVLPLVLVVVLLFGAAAAGVFGYLFWKRGMVEEHLRAAKKAAAKRDWVRAIAEMERVLKVKPEDAEAKRLLQQWRNEKKFDECVRNAEAAARKGLLEDALKWYEQALSIKQSAEVLDKKKKVERTLLEEKMVSRIQELLDNNLLTEVKQTFSRLKIGKNIQKARSLLQQKFRSLLDRARQEFDSRRYETCLEYLRMCAQLYRLPADAEAMRKEAEAQLLLLALTAAIERRDCKRAAELARKLDATPLAMKAAALLKNTFREYLATADKALSANDIPTAERFATLAENLMPNAPELANLRKRIEYAKHYQAFRDAVGKMDFSKIARLAQSLKNSSYYQQVKTTITHLVDQLTAFAREAEAKHNWQAARDYAQKALLLTPNNKKLQSYLSLINSKEAFEQFSSCIKKKDYTTARQAYLRIKPPVLSKAQSLLQHTLANLINEAKLAADRNNFQKSFALLQDASLLSPDSEKIATVRAELYAKNFQAFKAAIDSNQFVKAATLLRTLSKNEKFQTQVKLLLLGAQQRLQKQFDTYLSNNQFLNASNLIQAVETLFKNDNFTSRLRKKLAFSIRQSIHTAAKKQSIKKLHELKESLKNLRLNTTHISKLIELLSDPVKHFTTLFKLTAHSNDVCCVAWRRDSKMLATASEDRTIKVYDVTRNFLCVRTLRGHTSDVLSVSWSPDGRYLASGSGDTTVRIWDAKQGFKCITILRGHTEYVNSVSWSPDGRYLVSASDDDTARIWDAKQNFKCIAMLRGHEDDVNWVDWSPDGRYLASGSGGWGTKDYSVRIWDAKQAFECIATLGGHTSYVLSVSWSPDGRYLASGGAWDKTVRIWDAKQNFKCVATLRGHSDWVSSVSWSPDGRYLASASDDRTVRIWDAKQGFKCIVTLREHTGRVCSVSWSPNGRYLASGSADDTVRIWGVSQKKIQELLNAIDTEINKLTK